MTRSLAFETKLLTRPIRIALLAAGALLCASTAHAQLRPLDPPLWSVFDPATSLSVHLGVGLLPDQPATLAGTVGRLTELGRYQAAWRSGRLAIEAQGTVRRKFHDERRTDEPEAAVTTPGPARSDNGDHTISTTVRLTPDRPSFATVRFGTRLPNSNNRVGLDRDRTDFFAMLGGQLRAGSYRAAGEAGLGIFGSRLANYEQSDVLVYSATLQRDGALVSAIASVTGEYTPHMIPRGNEDRAETRVGVQVGRRLSLRLLWVHGLTPASPSDGVLIGLGATL